jgi:hypothetical protein
MQSRSLALPALLLAIAVGGCATVRPETAVIPPPVPPLGSIKKDLSVIVRGNPDVAVFKTVLERALGRAGFRVLAGAEGSALALQLIGAGSATSGANEAGSSVHQLLSIEMSVLVDGRLSSEHHSSVNYVAAYDRNDAHDSFELFNQRVGDYNRRAFEWLATDLTNQLIASLNSQR